jgi:hypothetical protein
MCPQILLAESMPENLEGEVDKLADRYEALLYEMKSFNDEIGYTELLKEYSELKESNAREEEIEEVLEKMFDIVNEHIQEYMDFISRISKLISIADNLGVKNEFYERAREIDEEFEWF